MAPKKGKGTAGALSFVAFTRLIRATKLALDRHLEDFAERLRVAPLSSTLIASMTRLVEADYATFLKSVEPYVEADSLPEGLSEDQLSAEVQQVRDLYRQIICTFEESCPASSAVGAATFAAPLLPPLPIPDFSGNIREWPHFKDQFASLIIANPALSGVQKFTYLRGALSGVACSIISHIPLQEAQFLTAWDLLCGHFDSHRNLALSLLDQLLPRAPQTPPHTTPQHLEALLEQVGCAETFLNIPADDPASFLLFLLLSRRLDQESQLAFELAYADEPFPTVKHLRTFLRRRSLAVTRVTSSGPPVRAAVTPASACASPPAPRRASALNPSASARTPLYQPRGAIASRDPSAQYVAPAPPVSVYSCEYCAAKHSIRQCPRFKTLSITQRRAYIDAHRLCRNCLSAKHLTTACRSVQSCRVCNKRHHTMLHPVSSDFPSAPLSPTDRPVAPQIIPSTSPPRLPLATPVDNPTATSPHRSPASASPPSRFSWADCPSPPASEDESPPLPALPNPAELPPSRRHIRSRVPRPLLDAE
ncbi:uncharacterized protein [Rhodnius prolixus]|uniref:uncharacterized protein n=1 Tax=Rhodnius prolixus TaxID=13249 RepID=UPI003D18D24C